MHEPAEQGGENEQGSESQERQPVRDITSGETDGVGRAPGETDGVGRAASGEVDRVGRAPGEADGDRLVKRPSVDATEPTEPTTGTTEHPTATGTSGDSTGGHVEERRLHPFTPLRRAWAPVAVVIGWAAHDPDQANERLQDVTLPVLLLVLTAGVALAALYGVLTWWTSHFAVTGTELRIRTGLLFRRTVHIRLDRLQAVDVNRPLLARLTGVAKLRLDVVGAEKKDELAFLGEREARELRAELLARAAGLAPETAHEVGEAPAEQVLRVPPRALAVALLLSGGTWVALVGAVVPPAVMWWVTHSPLTVLAVALPLLGAAGKHTAGRFASEYDWTLARSPDGLRLDHGLLDRAHETVPPGRVQSVSLVEPVLWRRRGWARVEMKVAGSSNNVLVPVAPRALAVSVIEGLLPDLRVPTDFSPAPRRARWLRPFWWRGLSLAVTDTVFAVRHGRLARTVTLVPHAKVQSVRLRQGPLVRGMRLASVSVDTGADSAVTTVHRDADEAAVLLLDQAERSRTGRRDATPDRWMTGEAGHR